MSLNPAQLSAVNHLTSHQLIVAGPGTGKTHTLTQKILHLLIKKGIPAQKIVAVTFTKKAAREMEERLTTELKKETFQNQTLPLIGTFHALALQLQNAQNITILQPKKQDELIAALNPSLKQKEKKEFKRVMSLAKNQLTSLNEIETFLDPQLVDELYNRYAETLEQNEWMDFDDLIINAINLLKSEPPNPHNRPSWLFIDEYQDINELQYRFIKLLAGANTKICAIGDPDQSIYAFRGSNIEYFLRFEKDFSADAPKSPVDLIHDPNPVTVTLTQNYRSTPQIIAAAGALIQNNEKRLEKTLKSSRAAGPSITLHPFEDEWQEGSFIAREIDRLVGGTTMLSADSDTSNAFAGAYQKSHHFSDIAVLYRTKIQAHAIGMRLQKRGLPYQCVSAVPWYQKKEIQELLANIEFLLVPNEVTSTAPTQKVILQNYIREHRNLHEFKPSQIAHDIIENLGLAENQSPAVSENIRTFLATAPMFDSRSGEKGLRSLLAHFATLQEHDHYNPVTDPALAAAAQAITLMTLHAAKGLEFPVVFITGLEDGLLPLAEQSIQEERRLFYVGLTRAQNKLYLTHAQTRNKQPQKPSPFLTEIAAHIEEQPLPKRKTPEPDRQMSLI